MSKRRNSISNSKDPNFNLIPKIQRQGTLTNIKESFLSETKKTSDINEKVSFALGKAIVV